MGRRKVTLTQLDIIQTGTKLFLENGYTATSPKHISDELEISPGNLTYYYPTKEDLLAILIEMLADFQWKTVQDIVNEGETPITALCFELTAMAAMCETNSVARDLYISAYTNPKPLTIIRRSDKARAKKVFAEFCPDWSDEKFAEAETMVSGIEYATLMVTHDSPPLETRIAGAMNTILSIYGVPEERRKMKIEKALSLDYIKFGNEVLNDFKEFVSKITEQSFVDLALKRECIIQEYGKFDEDEYE